MASRTVITDEIDDIFYVFMGQAGGWVSQSITVATGSVFSHTGIGFVVHDDEEFSFIYGRERIVVPPGVWMYHSYFFPQDNALGPRKDGAIIMSYDDLAPKYKKLQIIRHRKYSSAYKRRLSEFISDTYGRRYSVVNGLSPITIITGEQSNETPVCTTLVKMFLKKIHLVHNDTYVVPGDLYVELKRSRHFTTNVTGSQLTAIDTSLIAVLIIVFAIFVWCVKPI